MGGNDRLRRAFAVAARTLILSWEYPPIVEGGLARHVRKLAEELVAPGRGGPRAHPRRRAAGAPRRTATGWSCTACASRTSRKDDLDAFISWVDHMNEDMRAAGAELGERLGFDLVHSHDWLVADAARRLARRFGVPWLVTVHATEYGRHQGWVDKHPQSHIHRVERRMVRDADGVIACSHYMRGHVAEAFGIAPARVHGHPERDRPDRPAAGGRPAAAARALRRAGRAARAAGRPAGLREGLPPRARRRCPG